MRYAEVFSTQFEWQGERLVHKPTGASFAWSSPNSESPYMTVNWGMVGSVLANGDDYEQDEVGRMATLLLEEKRKG